MTLTLELSPAQERELETRAEREGVPVGEYALRRLLPAGANGNEKLESVSALTGDNERGSLIVDLLRDFADMMAESDWDEECLRPTQRAQRRLFDLLDEALGLLPSESALPRPLLYPDGDGGLRLECQTGDRGIRLAIHRQSFELEYLYHQHGNQYALETPLTPTLLAQWLRWLSRPPQ